MAELPKTPPPSGSFSFTASPMTGDASFQNGAPLNVPTPERYHFPYPTTFIPIPYHTDTTLTSLSSFVIPMARSRREITVDVPTYVSPSQFTFTSHGMDVDGTHDHLIPRSTKSVVAHVDSDGLLLYVSQASYEEGTSPLSCWIPNKPTTERSEPSVGFEGDGNLLDVFQRCVKLSYYIS